MRDACFYNDANPFELNILLETYVVKSFYLTRNANEKYKLGFDINLFEAEFSKFYRTTFASF